MRQLFRRSALLCLGAGAVVAGGCVTRGLDARDQAGPVGGEDGVGTVGMEFTLPGGEQISAVSYTLTNGTNTYSGTIDVSSSNTISFVIAGVASGSGYVLTMNATSVDGTVACSGSVGSITVTSRATTDVTVLLTCQTLVEAGSVLVNGSTSNCPIWDTFLANPASAAPGGSVKLFANATGPDTSSLRFTWSPSAGVVTGVTLDGTGNASATFTCPAAPGNVTITMIVDDGAVPEGGTCPAIDTTGTITVPCTATVSVARIGDGSAPMASVATPVFIEQHDLVTGAVVGSPIPLPTATAGKQMPLTLTGRALREGALSTSTDGRYVTLAGYGVVPGTFAPSTTPSVPRVVGRIDASGHVDTSTVLTSSAFDGQSVRSSTINGMEFWVGGLGDAVVDGGPPTGGIWYIPWGMVESGTQLSSFPTRVVDVFGGQLYADGDTSNTTELFTVGTGLPNTGMQTLTGLPGMPAQVAGSGGNSFTSPWEFMFFDLLQSVPGLDTLYVATDQTGSSNPPGGIQKWTFNGATWSLATTFNLATPLVADGFRGLAGMVSGPSSVVLVASTLDNGQAPNRLAVFVDNGTTAGPLTLNGTVIATSPANTVYRGIATAPK